VAGKVNWTVAAWNDLQETAEFIAKDSPFYAAAFVREVRDAARTLSRLARRGRIVQEFGNSSIREIVVRNHRMIYKISRGRVDIIAFIHCAREAVELAEREAGD
jgi:plasmid stabilization system protein ParE